MTEVNFNDIKRRLYADGCTDLLRGVACLRWALLAGKSYEEAVRPWKTAIPELFDQGKARERQRRKQPSLCAARGAVRPSPIARLSASRDRNRRRYVHA
jgi:hypothetical protein